ncbi:MAG: flippase-like domain-containing protein, partial [Thermoplasmatales archaeon]|nr:flippase-like domain-containing protein [Thermoplasmatales archaeon]
MDIKKILPIIGIIILVYLLTTVDIPAVIKIFLSISPLYVFLCLFSVVPILISTNIQWQILLKKQKIHVSFFYSLKNIFIGYFYGFITPGGFGGYIRALYLKNESGQPLPKCVSNIVTFNTLDFLSLLVLGLIGGFFLSSRFPIIFIIILIVSIIVASLFIFFLKKKKSQVIFTKFFQLKIFSKLKDRLEDPIDTFFENLPGFKDILLPFSLSIFGWIIRFSELYLISR